MIALTYFFLKGAKLFKDVNQTFGKFFNANSEGSYASKLSSRYSLTLFDLGDIFLPPIGLFWITFGIITLMTWDFVTFPKIYLLIFSKKIFLLNYAHLQHYVISDIAVNDKKNGLCKTLFWKRCVSIIYRFIQHDWWLIFLVIRIIT